MLYQEVVMSSTRQKPNVIFIFPDQMRGEAMHCAGNKDIITPNLDKLASEGMSFANAISNTPLCVPARGALMTGRYPLSHRAVTNDLPLGDNETGIAEVLKMEGYNTGYIGKWHLDGIPRDKFTPQGKRRFGFDYWAAWECHHDYFNGKYYRDTPEPINIPGYEPDFQTDLAIDYIRNHEKHPFFLFISPGPPHNPYESVPQKYKDMYNPSQLTLRPNCIGADTRAIAYYYAAISALDWNLGRILQTIEKLNIAEDTIVIFSSDHGDMLWSHGKIRKEQPWEESIRIPLIIKWPHRIPEGVEVDALLSLVDIMPSLLSLCGVSIPDYVQGIDLSSVMLGKSSDVQKAILLTEPVVGDEGHWNEIKEWRGIRTKRYTYARWQDGKIWVLYDNKKDPYQLNNLAEKEKSKDLQFCLENTLQSLLEKTNDEFLPWHEHLRKLGLVKVWNINEKYLEGKHARFLKEKFLREKRNNFEEKAY